MEMVGDYILVSRVPMEEKSKGGIWLPLMAQKPMNQGIIKQLGKGTRMKDGSWRKPTVKVGDRVIFPQHAGTEKHLDGEDVLFMWESDFWAVIEG
jgi:chaperonin GroES